MVIVKYVQLTQNPNSINTNQICLIFVKNDLLYKKRSLGKRNLAPPSGPEQNSTLNCYNHLLGEKNKTNKETKKTIHFKHKAIVNLLR